MESPIDNSTVATGFVAKYGTFQPICGFSVTTKGSDWIIDTGATSHMTCDRNMFTQFSSNSSVPVIINANGASSPVMGSGTIYISPLLSISNVLFVPSLNCNLLSVSQLIQSHNCVFFFFPTYCTLQNIHTKEKISSDKRSEGLYYLEGNSQYTTTTTTTTPYPTRWGRLRGSTSAIMFYQVPYFYPNH